MILLDCLCVFGLVTLLATVFVRPVTRYCHCGRYVADPTRGECVDCLRAHP